MKDGPQLSVEMLCMFMENILSIRYVNIVRYLLFFVKVLCSIVGMNYEIARIIVVNVMFSC